MSELVLYEHIGQLLTLEGTAQKRGRHVCEADLGIINDGALVVDASTNKIVWSGANKDLSETHRKIPNVFSGENEVWLPELVECHTHLIYGGHRHHDYALRSAGKSYQEIAKEGGGILTTMKETRKATAGEMLENALHELERFQKFGVGVIEVKTGYGLTLENEIQVLEVVRALQQNTSLVLVPTLLAAHATPPEFEGKTDLYVETICKEWLPAISSENLATFFDVFIESGYFTTEQARQLCTSAMERGLKIKLHADQFNDIGGTAFGLEIGATSIDHLDNVSKGNIERFGQSETVAVLLPGASLFTGTPYPPARALIDAGARVALSTDYNPGTCPSRNLPLMTTLACSQMKMTVPEAIAAITYNAAAALDLEDRVGSLTAGKEFRVCSLHAESYEVLPYCFGELD